MAANRLAKLRARRTDPLIKIAGTREVYERISEDESVKYAVGVMQPLDEEYTHRTFEEGGRVREQLDKGLNNSQTTAEFEFQGSATNGTDVRVHSDIDLLTLHAHFFTIQPPGQPTNPYHGDVMADLRKLRTSSTQVLRSAYPKVKVDDAPGRCISLSGGSLQRKVDVVISNWWDTAEYQQYRQASLRGIHVFDSKTNTRVENRPFLHNARIEARDIALHGNVRKAARLLKSLKYDADAQVDISSYDITSIAYRIPDSMMGAPHGAELLLLENVESFLKFLVDNDDYRNSLWVPNEMRRIFGGEGATVQGLRQLHNETRELLNDINGKLARSLRKLAETRISY